MIQSSTNQAINQHSKRSPYTKPMTSTQNLGSIKIMQKQKSDTQDSQQNKNGNKNNSGHNYYEEYIKTYLANKFLSQKMKEILEERNTLIDKINQLQNSKNRKPEATSSTKKENVLEDSKSETHTNDLTESVPKNQNLSFYGQERQNYLIESNAKKRYRKKNHELIKEFICNINNCNKNYCSEASLAQHIKNKHPESYDKWRVDFKTEKHLKDDNEHHTQNESKLNSMCKFQFNN